MIKQFLNDPSLLLNAVGEGIYGFDLSGNAVFVNPAAERMTGWSAETLLGKKFINTIIILMPMARLIQPTNAKYIAPCLTVNAVK